MRCRTIKDGNVVWFGSSGVNEDGTAKLTYNKQIKYSANVDDKNTVKFCKYNFSNNQEAVKDSLTQRLSILRKELWYRASYGLPLLEKVNSKAYMDTNIASTVMSHPDVIRIESFESYIRNHQYTCNMKIISSYGDLILQI